MSIASPGSTIHQLRVTTRAGAGAGAGAGVGAGAGAVVIVEGIVAVVEGILAVLISTAASSRTPKNDAVPSLRIHFHSNIRYMTVGIRVHPNFDDYHHAL